MFRTLHYISAALLAGLALLSSGGPLPAPARRAASSLTRKVAQKELSASLPIVSAEPTVSEDWYEPNEEDFKPAYQNDAVNLAKQPWSEYWGWVKSFYAGNFLDSGWTKRCKGVLGNIASEEKRTQLRIKLNTIGRAIAAEWAKTREPRKIDTNMLINWGTRLKEATGKDDGEGDIIQKEIERIAQEVGVEI